MTLSYPSETELIFFLAAKHKNFRGQRSLLCVGFQNLIWFWHPLFVSRHTKQGYPISRRIMRQLVSYFRKITSERRAVNFIPTNPIITTTGTSIEHQREIQFIKWLRLHVYFKHALRRLILVVDSPTIDNDPGESLCSAPSDRHLLTKIPYRFLRPWAPNTSF